MLRRWVETKYRIPWTHESIQQLTFFDLLVAFWEDYYEKNPLDARRSKDGGVVFVNTGDELIDKWEEELARGLTPDLLEGLSPEQRQKHDQALDKLKKHSKSVEAEGLRDGFSDNYELERTGLTFLGGRG